MPKKRRSDGKGNVTPINTPERHNWKCPMKGCRASGTVYSKADAKLAVSLHIAMVHNTGK